MGDDERMINYEWPYYLITHLQPRQLNCNVVKSNIEEITLIDKDDNQITVTLK